MSVIQELRKIYGVVIKWFSDQQAPGLVRESSSKCKVETNCEDPQISASDSIRMCMHTPECACTHICI